MSLLNGLIGTASEVSVESVRAELQVLLAPNEKIDKAYLLIRDLIIFTDKRIILVDRQGMSGKKVDYHSIPYRSITHFRIETAGAFDLDAELRIWIQGERSPIAKRFSRKINIFQLQTVLASHIFRSNA